LLILNFEKINLTQYLRPEPLNEIAQQLRLVTPAAVNGSIRFNCTRLDLSLMPLLA